MSTVLHKPGRELDDPKELLLGFLDYYRSVIIRKIDGLTDAELRASRLPSGWTPLRLLKHLAYMERRWLCWGFRAEQLPDPGGDENQAGRWHAGSGDTAASLIAALQPPASKRGLCLRSRADRHQRPRRPVQRQRPSAAADAGVDPHLCSAGVCPPRGAPGRRAGTDRRHDRRITGTASITSSRLAGYGHDVLRA